MKRLIALILAVLFAVSCLSGVASAESDGTDMSFMKAFGFVSPDAKAEDAVTRLDLAKIYHSVAGGISSSAAEPEFTDVMPSDGGVVNFVADMGIMVGGGDGTFRPSENLTFAQFAKTIVTFLGYEAYANENGGYPYGYIIQAQRLGIIKSYPQSENDYVTYELVASAFKLASDVRMTYALNDEYHTDFNYLKRYKNINTASGIVSADNVTSIGDTEISPGYDEIVVGSKLYKLTTETFMLRNYVGKSMQVYYDEDDNIIWYEEYDNRTKKIAGEDIISMKRIGSELVIEYEDSGKRTLRADNGIYVVYNGSVVELFGSELFEILNDESYEASVEAIDNNADGSYDILFVDAYKSYIAKASIDGTIYTKNSGIISLGDFEEGDIPVLNITGKYLELNSITEGDVVNVFVDFDGKVNKIVVTVDNYTGKIEEFSYTDGVIAFDGNRFSLSSSVRFRKNFEKLKPGVEIKAYFNMDGEVCDFELVSDTDLRFGYIIAGSNKAQSLEETYRLKIFTESGSVIEAKFAEKVNVNGEGRIEAKDAYALAGFTDGEINRQIVIYKYNKQTDEIDVIYYCTTNESHDGLYMYEGFDGVSTRSGLPYKSSSMSFGGKLLVNSGTVVFAVPTDSSRYDTDLYQIKTISVFKNDDTKTIFEAYGTEADCPLADALVIKQNLRESEDLDDNMILVDKVSIKKDANGDTVQVVKGISSGAQIEYIFEEGALSGIGRGDVIFPSAQNANGVWERARLIYDTNGTGLIGSNPTDKYTADIRFCYGKVVAKGEGYISVEIESANGEKAVEHFNTSKFKLSEFNTSSKDGEASVGSELRIFDSKHYGDSASYVLVHTRRGDAKSIVIFNQI